jgi:hypothetical protein
MVDDQDVDKHITISSMCHEAAGKYIVDGENLVRRTTSPKMRHGYDLRVGGGRVEFHRGIWARNSHAGRRDVKMSRQVDGVDVERGRWRW